MRVIILAGGLGTRIAEETDVKPKPMVKINSSPILWHLMNTFAEQDFKSFAIALGYKGEVIKSWLRDLIDLNGDLTIRSGKIVPSEKTLENLHDWNIDAIDTGLDSLTGGRILQAMRRYPGERVIVTYGDGLANVNIKNLVEFHESHGRLATVTAVRPPARFGYLSMEGSVVTEFVEKSQLDAGWINGGYFVLEPQVADLIKGKFEIFEKDTLPKLVTLGELSAFHHEGFWQPMDTLRDKQILEKYEKASPRAPWLILN